MRVTEGKEGKMAFNEVTIDSVRLASISGEGVIILRGKDSEIFVRRGSSLSVEFLITNNWLSPIILLRSLSYLLN